MVNNILNNWNYWLPNIQDLVQLNFLIPTPSEKEKVQCRAGLQGAVRSYAIYTINGAGLL
jgi:hypothetical protein